MEKIMVNSLGLSSEAKVGVVNIGGQEVQVREYLPIKEKDFIITSAIQEAYEDGFLNKRKLDALFSSYVVLTYSNLSGDEDMDLFEFYDLLESNGIIDEIVGAIPEVEYNSLITYLEEAIEDFDKQALSVVGALDQFVTKLPKAMQDVNAYLSEFKPEQFKSLMEAVGAVGGNPDAITNMLFEGKSI